MVAIFQDGCHLCHTFRLFGIKFSIAIRTSDKVYAILIFHYKLEITV